MTNYNNYKKYYEALKNTNFNALSNIISSIQKIQGKYNSELGNISNGEWQDKVNPVLQQKLLFSSDAIQSLNNDVSVSIQSMIDNGSKLLEVLEQMKQKQIIIDGLTRTAYELNKQKSAAKHLLNSIKNSGGIENNSEYDSANSKYSSLSSKYNNTTNELNTNQLEMNELGKEADLLISKLQGISFTANIVGILSGSVAANTSTETTTTPSSTSAPTEAVTVIIEQTTTPTEIPIVTANPTFNPMSNRSTISFNDDLIEELGILIDKKTDLPVTKGNAYVASYNGMEYLIFFPRDSNGNIKTNLPLMIEFHGGNGPSNKNGARSLPSDRMGLYQIEQNPDTQAIIIIPKAQPKTKAESWSDKSIDTVKSIADNVSDSMRADKENIIVYGHSTGGRATGKYMAKYSEGVKIAVIIDGRVESETAPQLIGKPVLCVDSNAGGSDTRLTIFEETRRSLTSVDSSITPEYVEYKTEESKEIIESAIKSILKGNDIRLIKVIGKGAGHVTVRDLVTKLVDFYDILLK